MNRYSGNTGRVVKMPDSAERRESVSSHTGASAGSSEPVHTHEPAREREPVRGESSLLSSLFGRGEKKEKPSNPLGSLFDGIGGIFSKLSPDNLELEDLIIMLILFLMYRESGDTEMLIILGAMFLL